MSSRLQKTIDNFNSRIEGGAFYEAHQTLRTIVNRYVKSKKYQEAIDLLYHGALTLASNKDYASSSDLISYLLEVYREAGIKCTNEGREKEYKIKLIETLIKLIDSEPSLPDLSKKTISWSKEGNKSVFGDSDFHHIFGLKFLNNVQQQETPLTEEERSNLFSYAETHLILGNSETLPHYIDFLYRWYEEAPENCDPGVFIGRAVINYAYLKNIHFARDSLDKFIKKLIDSGKQYRVIKENNAEVFEFSGFYSTLLTFLQLLVITLTKEDAGNKFLNLYSHFKSTLAHYDLSASIEYLGRLYFNLNIGRPQGGQNMFANLVGDLFK